MALTTWRRLQMEDLVDQDLASFEPGNLLAEARSALFTLADNIISLSSLWQLLVILGVTLIGFVLSRLPVRRLRTIAETRGGKRDILGRFYDSLARILWPLVTVACLWGAIALFDANAQPRAGLRIAASLLNAFIVVRLVTSNMKQGAWTNAVAVIAWTLAALNILHWLTPISTSLDSTAFSFGDSVRISVLDILKSISIAIIAIGLSRFAGDAVQSRLKTTTSLNPSMAGLLGQILKLTFTTVAVLIAIQSLGVPLTAFAVFTGALGVGVGFGLQAIFSNFISGVIILFEKSIKVGDFIELQSGVTGSVREINIRSTLVTTNDNVDILVPNEEFIKAQVINWTHREAIRRIRVPFGVAYGTKKELVRESILAAAESVKWTHSVPGREPQVWLVGFGESSLDFELIVWITEEAVSRPAKIFADYNWAILGALEDAGIEIPFPQRDLHVRSSEALPVRMVNDED